MRSTIIPTAALCIIFLCTWRVDGQQAPFSDDEVATMQGFFMANLNIDGYGGVVASPDNNTGPGGSYYYHWARDGALCMHTLQLISSQLSDYDDTMKAYVKWELGVQSSNDPNGIDIRVEPKFFLPYGGAYNQGWCRPQTDAPGLRAITLIKYAWALIADNQEDFVLQYLYTNSSSLQGGLIKWSLDWIVGNWQSNTCDLWEEVQNNDFFWNRATMKHALFLGSMFAYQLGDKQSATTYLQTGDAINSTLINHWNGQYVQESNNRQQDACVINAFNVAYDDDGFFGPLDGKCAATINVLNNLFQNAFPINQQDSGNGIPGILYGRYQGDSYDGGNPWILTTCALAEFYYRSGEESLRLNRVPTPDDMFNHWGPLLEMTAEQSATITPEAFSRLTISQGDGILLRVRYHVAGAGFHLSEQLDKYDGYETSATDLTWSYATLLKAMYFRGLATSLLARYDQN